ncbi:MAG: winged helix-turn-helix transcriptional regulator [Planctomycetes bacterium]|nr:winged helix-turn-helix transcriptional regulator [Planctomycetota bacterium]MCB9885375.1 winged helix-turn-helix transcriptional regulator [Planctomycetota bacterium]
MFDLAKKTEPPTTAPWTFFTNHAHVLVLLARDPELRLRDVAERVEITERAVQRIVGELAAGGYLQVERIGRRNRYRIIDRHPLRHPVEAGTTLRELLALLK